MTSQGSVLAQVEPVSVEITEAQLIAVEALSSEIPVIPTDVFGGEANVRPQRDSCEGLRYPFEKYFVHKFNPSYFNDVREFGEVSYLIHRSYNIDNIQCSRLTGFSRFSLAP
jgi:hypothetical protein